MFTNVNFNIYYYSWFQPTEKYLQNLLALASFNIYLIYKKSLFVQHDNLNLFCHFEEVPTYSGRLRNLFLRFFATLEMTMEFIILNINKSSFIRLWWIEI